jgi:uncharacterized protein
MANPLRINTVELVRRPGDHRELDVTLPFSSFGVPDDRVEPDAPVHVHVRLDAMNDGVSVAGTVTFDWHGACRRCAIDTAGTIVADVDERYQERVTDPDAFEFDGMQLDLEPMVREVVLLEAPATPLHAPDCQGLCPVCGIDRNHASCECAEPASDSPWAALDQLRGDVGKLS